MRAKKAVPGLLRHARKSVLYGRTLSMSSPTRYLKQVICLAFLGGVMLCPPMPGQDVLGGITGTVKDATGAAVPDAVVRAHNIGTNLEVVQHSQVNGSYSVSNIPAGAYTLTFTKEGFQTETHTQVGVNANRTTTVDGNLQVGTVSTTVEVTATPLMNQVDITNGYVVDELTIQETPRGPGVSRSWQSSAPACTRICWAAREATPALA